MAKFGRCSWQSRSCSAWGETISTRLSSGHSYRAWQFCKLNQKGHTRLIRHGSDNKRTGTHPPTPKNNPLLPLPPRHRGNGRRDFGDHFCRRIINLYVEEHPYRLVPGLGQELEHVRQPAHVLPGLLERLQRAEVLPVAVADRLVNAVAALEVFVLLGGKGEHITSAG